MGTVTLASGPAFGSPQKIFGGTLRVTTVPPLITDDIEQARLYLLDGTDLGLLAEIKAAQKKQT